MKILNEGETRAMATLEPNSRSRPFSRSELRKEDRQKAFRRVEKSSTLATAYPRLKALKVNLLYFDHEIVSWGHGLLYRANLTTAKSMLHFECPSSLCKGGGFDLSRNLSSAVAGGRKSVGGVMPCQGSRDAETGKAIPCKTILHFKMTLVSKTKPAKCDEAQPN
jgi:hypothetical protein